MSFIRNLVVVCAFASTLVSPLAIRSVDAAPTPPVIVSTSTTATQLTINGNNFLPGTASVLLGSYGPLTLVSHTATLIVATLPPGITPGSYTLSVQITDKGKGDVDESVVTIGAVGPPGPKGDKGDKGDSGLSSLAGLGCDTGSLDKPDGKTVVTVAPDTGVIALKCLSSSTNPVLTVSLGPGPLKCNTVLGVTVCFFARYTVSELDAGGSPVPNGFTCAPSGLDQSPFPLICSTQRFGAGATVRLGTNTLTELAPSWAGCDSVNAGVCTLTLTAARGVGVTPVATP